MGAIGYAELTVGFPAVANPANLNHILGIDNEEKPEVSNS